MVEITGADQSPTGLTCSWRGSASEGVARIKDTTVSQEKRLLISQAPVPRRIRTNETTNWAAHFTNESLMFKERCMIVILQFKICKKSEIVKIKTKNTKNVFSKSQIDPDLMYFLTEGCQMCRKKCYLTVLNLTVTTCTIKRLNFNFYMV